VYPFDEQVLWNVSLNGDKEGRYPPDATAAARRSREAGADCGTTTGSVFAGSVFAGCDEAGTWEDIARHLHTLLAVEILEARRTS
jgi:hypothetical protein